MSSSSSSSSLSSSTDEDIFQDVLPKLMSTIRAASALGAQDVNFLKSVDADIGAEIDTRGVEMLSVVNGLLRCASSQINQIEPLEFGKENITSDSSWKPIGNIIDSIFEKIDYTFDQVSRRRTNDGGDGEGSSQKQYLEEGISISHLTKDGKNARVPKPQKYFKVAVDNSEEKPFKPKLTTKPNSLQTLEAVSKLVSPAPVYEDSVELVDPPYYPHPYEYEIDNHPYPASILEKAEPIPPTEWTKTSAIWVDTVEELDKMIEELKNSEAIAVDLEHHDYRSYYGLVCLMQISNREKDWIIDTLKLRDDLSSLNLIFTNHEIVKVFHGAFMDIIWLQRDLGLYIVSLFDTYHASRQLGFTKFSLQYLLDTFAHFRTSKKYQLADWRIRPLPQPMLAYARSDTHFLLYIYDQLRNKLIDEEKLPRVLHESRQVAKRRFEYTKFRPLSNNLTNKVSCPVMASNPKEPWRSIMYQYNVPAYKKHIVELLYNWRDLKAREEDESVRYIMPNQLLVSLAMLESPVDTSKILNVPTYISEHVRLHAREIAHLIEQCLKESEQSDWEMVDKWHVDVSDQSPELLLNVAKVNDVFEALLLKMETTAAENPSLLGKKSTVFCSDNTQEGFPTSVFEVTSAGVVKHDFREARAERQEKVWNTLANFNPQRSVVVEDIDTSDHHDHQLEETALERGVGSETEPKKPLSGQQILFNKDKNIDSDQIVTLRNNSRTSTSGSSGSSGSSSGIKRRLEKFDLKVQQQDESPVDYVNADKILIDTDKKKDKNKKKRSFDPYSKDAEGPKAAKKNKTMTTGRTSTYKVKKNK
ncbi:RRP6 [Candida oxycetoniae]|uniref:RRP6 n=1 Tax=Candida oxycetoniae TaxID=497107 RepID=A0AAI9T1M2_9ASCO|nr:RRP6 [Candida oxycetoniae]KAI3406390.2 RRP6 [Candida oxycetoniae]